MSDEKQPDTYLKQLADEADMAGTYLSGVSGTSSGPQQSSAIAPKELAMTDRCRNSFVTEDGERLFCKEQRGHQGAHGSGDWDRKYILTTGSSKSKKRAELKAKWATIPPELAGCVADYATRICTEGASSQLMRRELVEKTPSASPGSKRE